MAEDRSAGTFLLLGLGLLLGASLIAAASAAVQFFRAFRRARLRG